MERYDGVIRNAEIVQSLSGHSHLYGNIYNSEKFEDGTPVATSRIIEITQPNETEERIVRTEHSLYFCPTLIV